jgi:hypothetical protein
MNSLMRSARLWSNHLSIAPPAGDQDCGGHFISNHNSVDLDSGITVDDKAKPLS